MDAAHDGRSDHRVPPPSSSSSNALKQPPLSHPPPTDADDAHRSSWRPAGGPITTPRGHAPARGHPDGGGPSTAPNNDGPSKPPLSSAASRRSSGAGHSSPEPAGNITPFRAPQLPPPPPPSQAMRAYNLMVAGARTSKTSFLRLLLDTSAIAPSATPTQRDSVARFVQAGAGPTSHIRACSIDIEHERAPVSLTLIDTPTLDVADVDGADRLLVDISRYIDDRFAQSVEDEPKGTAASHHVHLCLYFLDPDSVVPPTPSALPHLRGVNGGLILEPPVPTNPAHTRAALAPGEINAIRRLSARVNVLPVVARADTLTNERLAAVKLAVRRDLAEAGIGFGIFDTDVYPVPVADAPASPPAPNGGGSGSGSPALPPTALQLPYAVISPESYAHSDGTNVVPLVRHDLVRQFAPGVNRAVRGRFLRSFRWGTIDVLEPRHSDFAPLRSAIFQHMETLLKYTRDYLYERFKAEVLHAHPAQAPPQQQQQSRERRSSAAHMHPYSGPLPQQHPSGAPPPSMTHSPPQHRAHAHVDPAYAGGHPPPPIGLAPGVERDHMLASAEYDHHRRLSNATDSGRQRAKKITVACNFCRSRKLKCDGGRPACSQCVKRSVACDYIPHVKRRGPGKYKVAGAGDDSGEEGGSDEESSPEPRPDSPVNTRGGWDPTSGAGPRVREDERAHYARSPETVRYAPQQHAPAPPPPRAAPASPYRSTLPPPPQSHEMGVVASVGRARASTLGGPSSSAAPREAIGGPYPGGPQGSGSAGVPPPPGGVAHTLPPMRAMSSPPEEPSLAGSKRRLSQSFSKTRASNAGSKVVACNFCRARKTKCDSIHPTCSSCARRQLPCSYVNEPGVRGAGVRRLSSASVGGANVLSNGDPRSATSSKSSSHSHSRSPPPASSSSQQTQPGGGPLTHGQQPPPPHQQQSSQHRESGPRLPPMNGVHAHTRPSDAYDDEAREAPTKKLRLDNGYDGPPPVAMHATVAPLQ